MGLDSCMKCIKYTLFIFNFFFWLVGVGILAFGLYLLIKPIADEGRAIGPDEDVFHPYRIALIVVGSIIMLLGFLGCCGSILENKCMLLTFFIIMTLVFLALVVIGLLLVFMKATFKKTMVETLETDLQKLLRDYKNSSDSANRTDTIHHMWACCGINDGSADFTSRNLQIPDSCKKNMNEGCTKKFANQLEEYWFIIVIVIFSVASVTLIGMVLSMLLCCALRDEYDY